MFGWLWSSYFMTTKILVPWNWKHKFVTCLWVIRQWLIIFTSSQNWLICSKTLCPRFLIGTWWYTLLMVFPPSLRTLLSLFDIREPSHPSLMFDPHSPWKRKWWNFRTPNLFLICMLITHHHPLHSQFSPPTTTRTHPLNIVATPLTVLVILVVDIIKVAGIIEVAVAIVALIPHLVVIFRVNKCMLWLLSFIFRVHVPLNRVENQNECFV